MKTGVICPAFLLLTQFCAMGQSGWVEQRSGTGIGLRSCHFQDTLTGWVVGGGNALTTSDGGINWSPGPGSPPSGNNGVYFVNRSLGWIVGPGAIILKTSDGGANWFPQNNATGKSLIAIHFPSADTGWAVGDTILYTEDGGATWMPQNFPERLRLLSIFAVNGSTAWAVGGGRVYKTADGGANWARKYDGSIFSSEDVYFINPNTGWVVGGICIDFPWSCATQILKTETGGDTWTSVTIPSSVILSVHFVDTNNGWVVGMESGAGGPGGGIILKSSNGGANWTRQDSGISQQLYSVNFVNSTTGWAVGNGGTILKTTTGGEPTAIFRGPRVNEIFLSRTGDLFRYRLSHEARVRVVLRDLRGKTALQLLDARQPGGKHVLDLSSVAIPAGLYWLEIHANGQRGIEPWFTLGP